MYKESFKLCEDTNIQQTNLPQMGSLLALSSLFCAVKATSFLTVVPVWCEWELFAGEQIAKRPYSRTWLSRLRVWISLSLPDSLKSCAYDEELTLKFQTQLYLSKSHITKIIITLSGTVVYFTG